MLKTIKKVDKRTSLSTGTFNDVLLNADKIPLEDFNPDPSIDLWWNAKSRRLNQRQQKEYKKLTSERKDNKTDSEDSEEDVETLQDWDEWMSEEQ